MHRGICANLRFDFLAQWLWQQIARVVDGVGADSPYAAARLSWRVHAAFGDAAFVAPHPRLAAYLRGADALMRYELACQVAGLLEQYVTYRSDWLQAWREGQRVLPQAAAPDDEAWQAALWQRIEAELGPHARHPADAFVAALQRGGQALARRAGLPQTVHVFALPTVAPQHLRLLHQLARWIDVQLYVLNPCQEYWFDLVDRRRLSHLAARGRAQAVEEGNRLLAAWGKQTQAHVESLVELCGEGATDDCRLRAGGRGQPAAAAAERAAGVAPDRARLGTPGAARPQHRAACVPFAEPRARGAAGPPARPVRRRPPSCAPATCWWSRPTWTRPHR